MDRVVLVLLVTSLVVQLVLVVAGAWSVSFSIVTSALLIWYLILERRSATTEKRRSVETDAGA